MTLLQIQHLCWNPICYYVTNELSSDGVPCISLKASDYESNNNLWIGSIMIMKLERSWKLMKFENLKDPSKILVLHFKKEYKTYILKEKDSDAEKAILGNHPHCYFCPISLPVHEFVHR